MQHHVTGAFSTLYSNRISINRSEDGISVQFLKLQFLHLNATFLLDNKPSYSAYLITHHMNVITVHYKHSSKFYIGTIFLQFFHCLLSSHAGSCTVAILSHYKALSCASLRYSFFSKELDFTLLIKVYLQRF